MTHLPTFRGVAAPTSPADRNLTKTRVLTDSCSEPIKGRLLLTLFLLAFAVPAFGSSFDLDFALAAGGGGIFTINNASHPTEATGTSIPIGVLSLYVEGLSAGSFTVTGACGGYGCLSFNTNGEGAIEIVGGVEGFGNLGSTPLLQGTMDAFSLTKVTLGTHFNVWSLSAIGPDTKNPNLLTDLGIPAGLAWGYFGVESTTNTASANTRGLQYTVSSVDIGNFAQTTEPGSMLLMGTLLSIAGGWLARKKRA